MLEEIEMLMKSLIKGDVVTIYNNIFDKSVECCRHVVIRFQWAL